MLHCIGAGSFGEVWLARTLLDTRRAVKIVYRSNVEEKDAFDREFKGLRRFEPISRAHEGLVDILQVGSADGCLYYVMELADAQGSPNEVPATGIVPPTTPSYQYTPRTLRGDLMLHSRLPVDQCVDLGLHLTSALAHLHQNGLVHRDVKPSNIIFVDDQPKLADAGLVADSTEARSFVGTAGFIPPEGPGSPQADLYSLGKVLYEAATGLDRQQFPQLPGNMREYPDHSKLTELNEVILKACDPDPKLRYASAHSMREHLLRVKEGKSIRQLRQLDKLRQLAKRLAAFGLLPAILAAVIVWQSLSKGKPAKPVRFPSENAFVTSFDDDRLDQWLPIFTDVRFKSLTETHVADGTLRIRGAGCRQCTNADVFLARPELQFADFQIQADLTRWQGWNHVGLAALSDLQGPSGYVAAITFNSGSYPGRASLWVWSSTPNSPASPLGITALDQLDPAKTYRLVFARLGSVLYLQCFDLTNLNSPLAQLECPVPDLSKCSPAVYARGGTGVLRVSLDRFSAAGLTSSKASLGPETDR